VGRAPMGARTGHNARSKGPQAHNGILLHGEPGNGKTMYAHVVADLLGLPIIEVGLGTIKSRWINQTAIQISKLFADAHRQAPCVLLLDEATSLLESRAGSMTGHEEDKKATDAFLQELDRIRGHGVVVIAACNHVDRLDPAAVRPGRFDDRKLIPNPDAAARAGIIEQAARLAKLDVSSSEVAAVNPWWEGFSVALVRELARKGVALARAEGARALTADALERALKIQQGGESELRAQVPSLAELVQTPAVGQELNELARMLEHAKTLLRGGKVERGAVFAGPPGTGKTLSAQALAKSVGWNFVATSGPNLLTHGRIEEVFAKASRLRPCVVLIDEAEAAIGQRGHGGMADAVTAKMLTMLDGADNKAIGLFFVVCTNHPEALDSAVVRPGRIGRTITFEHADAHGASARDGLGRTQGCGDRGRWPGRTARRPFLCRDHRAAGTCLQPCSVGDGEQGRPCDHAHSLVGLPRLARAHRSCLTTSCMT
jgi:transitional endoplasmic reticulum ATPase